MFLGNKKVINKLRSHSYIIQLDYLFSFLAGLHSVHHWRDSRRARNGIDAFLLLFKIFVNVGQDVPLLRPQPPSLATPFSIEKEKPKINSPIIQSIQNRPVLVCLVPTFTLSTSEGSVLTQIQKNTCFGASTNDESSPQNACPSQMRPKHLNIDSKSPRFAFFLLLRPWPVRPPSSLLHPFQRRISHFPVGVPICCYRRIIIAMLCFVSVHTSVHNVTRHRTYSEESLYYRRPSAVSILTLLILLRPEF